MKHICDHRFSEDVTPEWFVKGLLGAAKRHNAFSAEHMFSTWNTPFGIYWTEQYPDDADTLFADLDVAKTLPLHNLIDAKCRTVCNLDGFLALYSRMTEEQLACKDTDGRTALEKLIWASEKRRRPAAEIENITAACRDARIAFAQTQTTSPE